MSVEKFIVTGHVAVEVSIDVDSPQWDYLKEHPREDWANIVGDDEDISKLYQKQVDAHRIYDGWLEVEEADS